MEGRYCSCLLPRQDGKTSQILVNGRFWPFWWVTLYDIHGSPWEVMRQIGNAVVPDHLPASTVIFKIVHIVLTEWIFHRRSRPYMSVQCFQTRTHPSVLRPCIGWFWADSATENWSCKKTFSALLLFLPRAYSTLLLSLSSRHKIISQARIWLFDRYLSLPSPFSGALWKANWCKINPHWFSVIICPIDARRVSLSLCRRAF